MLSLIVLVLVSWAAVLGDSVLKWQAGMECPSMAWCEIVALIYGATAPGWLYILQHRKMSTAIGVLFPAIQGASAVYVGYRFFGERVTARTAVGLLLAFLAVALLATEEAP